MESTPPLRRHLDATTGRPVVYCHLCRNEWYQDEHDGSLACPRCHSEATEIISVDNDPRPTGHDVPRGDFLQGPGSDADPDEEDIEQHFAIAPGGFFGQSSILRRPEQSSPGAQARASPNDGDDIARRFDELIGTIGGPNLMGRQPPPPPPPAAATFGGPSPGRITYQSISGPGFRNGVSSFSITTGVGGGFRSVVHGPGPAGQAPEEPQDRESRPMHDEFDRIFQELFQNMGAPPTAPPAAGEPTIPERERNGPENIATALNQLMASFLNPGMVHGDAVYSNEALDRIISNLMEANPQSNAAAPATQNAINNLLRKNLDQEMLGQESKAECTICIDDMKLGDEACVLPCKHWFHNDCVVLWLREHNSCPVCRAPIDGENAGQPAPCNNAPSQPTAPPGAASASGAAERRRNNLRNNREDRLDLITGGSGVRTSSRRASPSGSSPGGQSPRTRSASPTGHQSPQADQTRDRSSGGGPFSWLRERFAGGDRRY